MPKKTELTAVQAKVLDYVKTFQAKRGFPPTRVEISTYFKWKSKNASQEALRAIERKGWIKMWPETPRGISVL
ncbi:MAG: hypothetical protein OEW16_11655 [Gammaproteobacteria bacterium]|nr:hypothetical protein [Gammaproteobacteria bacterium]